MATAGMWARNGCLMERSSCLCFQFLWVEALSFLPNRLATAQDQTHWYNSYVYDAWGNLTQKNKGALPGGENMSTSADTGNHLLGYSYDAGGNMTSDGVNTYVYDGENRVSSVAGVSYTYDADGRRVKKSSGTNYWYGPSGEALAETDSAGTWTNYVFFGGIRLARNVNGDIKYYITDHLHSTAVFADKSGTVLDDNDFYPWGGVVPGVGQTTSNNTIKFTGKYRDTESGHDYFGARYYANVMGRFMSPDWAAEPVTVPYAEFGDPQSLNLYAYVRNHPVVTIDADGHSMGVLFNEGFEGFDSFWNNFEDGNGIFTPQPEEQNSDKKCGFLCKLGNIFQYGDVHWRTTTQIINDERQYLKDKGVGIVGPDRKLIDLDKASNKQIDDAFRSLRNIEIVNSLRESLGLPPLQLPSLPNWSFGSNKSAAKWQRQMAKRGWTNDQISEAIEKGQKFPAPNKISPANGATRYVNPTTGRSVILDNATREVIHVGGDGFSY